MLIKNSRPWLAVCLIYITFGDSVQGLDGNEGFKNYLVILEIEFEKEIWYLGDRCLMNITQQEGICTKKSQCEKPCAANNEQQLCQKRVKKSEPIVCCALARNTSSISVLSKFLTNYN